MRDMDRWKNKDRGKRENRENRQKEIETVRDMDRRTNSCTAMENRDILSRKKMSYKKSALLAWSQ